MVRRPVKEYSEDDDESNDGHDVDEDRFSSSPIDAGLAEFAKKLPMFEPWRAELNSDDRPLLVNLDLALYRAKVLARNYKFKEAEKILEKVPVILSPVFLLVLFGTVDDIEIFFQLFSSVYTIGQKMGGRTWL